MKYLIAGATGFIGSNAGHDVIGIDNLNNYYEVNLKEARLDLLSKFKKFRFIKLDLADRAGQKHENPCCVRHREQIIF